MAANEASDSDNGSDKPQITEEEVIKQVSDKILEAMKIFDPEGNNGSLIQTDKLKEFLEYCEFKMDDRDIYKIISDLDPGQKGQLDGVALKQLMIEREVEKNVGQDETELLDAYVAMGGEPDGGGCVDAAVLIKTIKEDFQMTIDIEKLIEEVDEDGSGEIEFEEFKELLKADGGVM